MPLRKRNRRVEILIAIAILLSFCGMLFWSELKMRDYGVANARCYGPHRVKSGWYYRFAYQIDGKTYYSVRQGYTFTPEVRSYLERTPQIKIAFSKSDYTYIRILDENLADEWLWFVKK